MRFFEQVEQQSTNLKFEEKIDAEISKAEALLDKHKTRMNPPYRLDISIGGSSWLDVVRQLADALDRAMDGPDKIHGMFGGNERYGITAKLSYGPSVDPSVQVLVD